MLLLLLLLLLPCSNMLGDLQKVWQRLTQLGPLILHEGLQSREVVPDARVRSISGTGVRMLLFFVFFSSIYYLSPSSLSPTPYYAYTWYIRVCVRVVTQIRGHIRSGPFFPLPSTLRAFHFYGEKTSDFSSLFPRRLASNFCGDCFLQQYDTYHGCR